MEPNWRPGSHAVTRQVVQYTGRSQFVSRGHGIVRRGTDRWRRRATGPQSSRVRTVQCCGHRRQGSRCRPPEPACGLSLIYAGEHSQGRSSTSSPLSMKKMSRSRSGTSLGPHVMRDGERPVGKGGLSRIPARRRVSRFQFSISYGETSAAQRRADDNCTPNNAPTTAQKWSDETLEPPYRAGGQPVSRDPEASLGSNPRAGHPTS